MKILAVDFGMKRVGFAVGNALIQTAVPIEPVRRQSSKQVIARILELLDEYDINRIIIGYPLNMDGSKSTFTEQVEHFSRRLKKAVEPGVPVFFVDERLSSFEAEETLKSLHPDYKKRKHIIDSMAAMVILQRFMEEGEDVGENVGENVGEKNQ